MAKMRQIWLVAVSNFRRWRHNPQVLLTFGMGFVISFLLSNKVLLFAEKAGTVLQMLETFIWTFGDANSILLISLCLLLLFADMPNVGNEVPFFLVRMDRRTWLLGQIMYQVLATLIFVAFVLLSTCVLASPQAYPANLWSETAAILAYSNIGQEIAVPAFVKVLELSSPLECAMHIFGLMAGYAVLMSSIILHLNLWRSNLGMVGGVVFSCFGFLVTPDFISNVMGLAKERIVIANIVFGWISPLNHATYYMHNFGYDNLPKLWVSYVLFAVTSLLVFGLSLWRIRNYSFQFTGTQR